ncbi:hypothetical protein CRV24_008793 [Beauveria bassiana]|nr:hypothetical protein CRV24_008793 [Beauveria bassiana]
MGSDAAKAADMAWKGDPKSTDDEVQRGSVEGGKKFYRNEDGTLTISGHKTEFILPKGQAGTKRKSP